MRTKGLAIAVAVLLATAATTAVFLYTRGVKKDANPTSADMVTVVVPKQDVAAGTKLDGLISSGAFTTLRIPDDAIVQGAVTDLAQLRGRTTSTFILAGEQITTARLQGSTQATGGVLGIPAGHVAVTIALKPEQVPGRVLQAGDHVTAFGTFSSVNAISGTTLEKLIKGKVPAEQKRIDLGDFTLDLVPDVQVLKITGQEEGTSVSGENQTIYVTLALLPADASNVVFAQEKGSVWLALIAPGEEGELLPPASYLSSLESLVGNEGGQG